MSIPKLTEIHTGTFYLDGGAMFGVVPQVIWKKMLPPTDNNLTPWAMRCLLVEEPGRKILIDTGMGGKNPDFYKKYYHYDAECNGVLPALKQAGISPDQITDVLFTHLHFDHCGGASHFNQNGVVEAVFKNATYWVSREQWEWAINPNPREKPSFVPDNLQPLENTSRLNLIERMETEGQFSDTVGFMFADGHTRGQLIPTVALGNKTLVFCADLIPSAFHLKTIYFPSYDVEPLKTMDEKNALLQKAASNHWVLFFEHDPHTACATVVQGKKGYQVDKCGSLTDFL